MTALEVPMLQSPLFSRSQASPGTARRLWSTAILVAAVAAAVLPWPLAAQSIAASSPQPPPLPALGLAVDATTVSGLSSGGYMAGQFHVAYSASLAGAAVLAAGPYGCSGGSVSTAMFDCACPVAATPAEAWALAWADWFPNLRCRTQGAGVYASRAADAIAQTRPAIDDPAELKRQRVYLFSGGQDPVVRRELVDAAAAFYRQLGVPAASIRRRHLAAAGHALATPAATQACSITASPFLNHCGTYDAPGELLRWLYPARAGQPAVRAAPVQAGALQAFDQTPYRRAGRFDGLDDSGWLYVPAACRVAGARCRLHVVFHGCQQGQGFTAPDGQPFGRRFVDGAGYNTWAEGSRMVVLYPQVKASNSARTGEAFQQNPEGCWDFWGYTDPTGDITTVARHFARQPAPQMQAVKAMVDALWKTSAP
jgi:poly(3-hydroxybutyrate) depolymerase